MTAAVTTGPGSPPALDPALRAAAEALVPPTGRRLLGLTGVPGAGKSTLAVQVVAALGEVAAYVPMDGFHLSNLVLERLGRRVRKGAPDTFDRAGFHALLGRLRTETDHPVYAPAFHREIEESIAAEITVEPTHRLVVTEGNYLLVWPEVAALLDQVWYVETASEDVRLERLTARHVEFGKQPALARDWARGSDEANARLVRATREKADRIIVHD